MRYDIVRLGGVSIPKGVSMTKTAAFSSGRRGGDMECMLCESASYAQRARLFPEEDGAPLK